LTSDVSGDLTYAFAAEVRSALVDAYNNYADAPGNDGNGFDLPDETDVNIDDWGPTKTAEWDWMSKDIDIPITYSNLAELQHDVAHELFHAVQNQYVSFLSMDSSRWWMEATADYAAGYVGTNGGLGGKLPLDFIKKPLNSGEESHTYQVAYFLKYLSDKGINFRDLFVSTMNSDESTLEAIDTFLSARGKSLIEFYNDFAAEFVRGRRVSRIGSNADISENLADYLGEYLQGEDPVSMLVTLKKNYVTKIAGFEITGVKDDEEFAVVLSALEPTAGVRTRVIVSSTGSPGDIVKTGVLEVSEPMEVEVGDGYRVYFVASNGSTTPGTVTVAIEGLQEEEGTRSLYRRRVADIYNKQYTGIVNLRVSSSAPFKVGKERVILNNEGLYLMIGLVNVKPDESAVVKLDLDLTSFASVDPNKIATISEAYWGTSSGKVYGNTIRLRLGPDSGYKTQAIYQIIIKFTKVDDKSQIVYSGGGATLAYIVVSR
jgi:putative component of toxin-antitoxin plasmid stabilization module